MTRPSDHALRTALWGLLALVMVAVVGTGARSLLRGRPIPGGAAEPALVRPPAYGHVPDFSLIERSGRRVDAAELRGMVWVADFIYTRCTDTCPVQSAQMAGLQAAFSAEPDFRLVSITVDPLRDRPEVLARYAERFRADAARWLFLTGRKEAILALAQEGFRLPVADPADAGPSPLDRAFPPERPRALRVPLPSLREKVGVRVGELLGARPALAHDGAAAGPILHSARFVLVDRQSRIRGYYDSGDGEAIARLRRDARTLLRDPRP